MDVQRAQRKINHKNFLQHYLHSRMAASSGVILAGLLCVTDVVAEPRTWISGSAYVPEAATKLPTPTYGLVDDKTTWVQSGEVTDASGKTITVEIKDSTGKTVTGAITEEQFNQLKSYTGDTEVLRIDQKSNRLILNWKNFDIGETGEVKFVQPSTTSLALNKINDSTSPSAILGKLSANGGVYLINHNGIVFGKDSQVNVGSLVASSLDVDDNLFINKSLSKAMTDENKAAFSLNENKDATGIVVQADTTGNLHLASDEIGRDENAAALRGDIAVQKGANINTTTLNGAVLVAPNVVNNGDIKTPDGQTILAAAKDEAFVLFSSDPALRGLLIEVNAGGDVTNLGNIIAERGNVTLAGLAVNQNGKIKATTSVDFNGTVRLLARDTLTEGAIINSLDQVSALLDPNASTPVVTRLGTASEKHYRVATHAGAVVLGEGSSVEVAPELDSKKTAPDAQGQSVSGVEISGNTIDLQKNAVVVAKGGRVFLDATDNLATAFDPASASNPTGYLYNLANKSRITLAADAKIDVSGVHVDLPMSRNVVEVELRGTELADSPLQRSGFLYGKKVLVDIRKGTPLGDISGALAAIPKSVGERLTQGGSIQLRSAGDVVVQPNAKLDVSGGGIHYASGYVETTNLLSDGKIVNIADADPNRSYTGILGKETATNKRFNITETFNNFFISSDRGEFVNAFDQGSSAGSLTLKAQAASFHGTLQAGVLSGLDQRQPTKTNHPDGGTFTLEVNLQSIGITDTDVANCNEITPCVLLKMDTKTKATFATDTLNISQNLFNESGFEHYNIAARNGSITLAKKANLHLTDGASLNIFATDHIDVNGTIKSTGGKIAFTTAQNAVMGNAVIGGSYDLNNVNRPISFGNTAIINTSGGWYNDNPLLSGNDKPLSTQTWIDAGAVTLKAAGDLILNAGSEIVANGGGWINRLGSFVAGRGGNITLSAQRLNSTNDASTLQAGAHLNLEGATLKSFAFATGGELSITAPSIRISGDAHSIESPETFLFNAERFQEGGFSSFNLTAKGSKQWVSHFTIDEYTDIKPLAFNYSKNNNNFDLGTNATLNLMPAGSNLESMLGVAVLPGYERNPVNLNFSLNDQSSISVHSAGSARDNNMIVPAGVRFITDPKARINVSANTSIAFDGIILDNGGTVNFSLQGFQGAAELDYANFDDVGIWLGSNSVIDLSSHFIVTPPGSDGLARVGKVVNAGSLSLATERGFVITEQGSIVNISAQAYATERYVSDDKFGSRIDTTVIPAQAGSFSIKAAEGILFNGELNAKGAGYGALGGTLNVELNRGSNQVPDGAASGAFGIFDFSTITFGDRKIVLVQDVLDSSSSSHPLLQSLGKNDGISDSLNGEAKFSVKALVESGLDSYLFNAGFTEQPEDKHITSSGVIASADKGAGKIIFDGDVSLVAGRSIELKSTTIGSTDGRGMIAAPNIKIGVAKGLLQDTTLKVNTGAVSGGVGELFFAATDLKSISDDASSYTNSSLVEQLLTQKTIDILPLLNSPSADGLLSIVGHVATQGADSVTLASAGDLRTSGLLVGDGKGDNARYLGSFSVDKNLTLQADQIFPTTLSEFIFSSGQYDFSKVSSFISNDGTNATSLNSANAVTFALQYTDKNGVLQTETELATTYEAYDFIEGKLGIGDTVVHPDQAQIPVKKTIVSIQTPARAVTGNPEGAITILAGGKSSSEQSAAGILVFDAPNIEQNGTLKAPFGQIVFNTQNAKGSSAGKGSVVMGEGSVTSVSAENSTIVFGELDASGALTYSPNPADQSYGVRLFTQSPEAKVVVNSANVDLHNSATVDLSGGGDLLNYRFVPGPGGSKDVLAAINSGKTFVVVPGIQGQYAAYDPAIINEPGNANLHTGRSLGEKIYLSGSAGLPAGEYTILPARYALLPGAFLVTPTGDGQVYSQGQQVRRVDGTPVVAGRFTVANTGEYDSQYSGFIVEPGAIAKTRSEYVIAKASDLFTGVDSRGNHKSSPKDAAGLSISASASLNLEATVVAAVEKGQGPELDIASTNLLIIDRTLSGASQSGTFTGGTPAVQVLVSQLAGFDSILIGGTRTRNSDGSSSIKATAQQVEVAKNTQLSAPNILLTAKGVDAKKGIVKLNSGSQVTATGAFQQQTTEVTFFGDSLLSVSSGKPVVVTQNATQNSGTQGDLLLGKDSVVHADNGSVLLLSNAQTQLDGSLQMQGGALNVGAGRVSLGQVNNSVPGLKFTNESLANLKVDSLQITSSTSLDLYGTVNLNFADLILQASSLQGFNGNGTAVSDLNTANIKAANSITLRGNSTALPTDINLMGPGLGKGSLTINTDKLVLGKGNLAIGGFEQLSFTANTALVGQGSGLYRSYGSKNLTLDSPLMTGTGASSTQLLADGVVKIQASGSVSEATLKTYNGLGSRWAISGRAIDYTGNAILPSGELTLRALGTNGENLNLGSGTKIDVSGRSVMFDDVRAASNGGSIKLTSASGNVVLDKNSSLNISGVADTDSNHKDGSDAGKLSIQALVGNAELAGSIAAVSGAKSKGGSLDLAVKAVTDFSNLIKQVVAGNFSEAFGLRVSTGDLTLKTGEQLKAHSLSLTADSGSITIGGSLNASGDKGQITLNASKDLTLESTAQLSAASTNDTKGGNVFLGASGGFINVFEGAKINVLGGGSVTLRAPRTQNGKIITGNQVGDDVAINLQGANTFDLRAVISDAVKVNVNAFKVYDILAATSEIFNTDVDGNSTLSEATATLSYLDAVPFGALCGQGITCTNLIKSKTDGNVLTFYPDVESGQPLPVGALCGDSAGCSYSYQSNTDKTSSTIANIETKTFMDREAAMESRLFGVFKLNDSYHLKPELELRSSGDLMLDQAIDFGEGMGIVEDRGGYFAYGSDTVGSSWRFNDELVSKTIFDPLLGSEALYDNYTHGEAGVLTLRAQGNIVFNSTISDGFIKGISYGKLIATGFTNGLISELSSETNGWDYHITAGADLSSANQFSTKAIGQMNIAPDVVVRTSTGDIKTTVAGNLLLGDNAAIYTAGYATGRGVFDDFTADPDNANFDQFDYLIIANATYATGGGTIDLKVGKNIRAEGEQEFVTDWLQRAGGQVGDSLKVAFPNNGYLPTTWAIVYEKFKQGIATLGGGDVYVNAEGDIQNISVAVPTTGKNNSHYDSVSKKLDITTIDNVLIQGGGNLSLNAGGDILSGQFYVAKGTADIHAAGNISSTQNGNSLLLEMADSKMTIAAGGRVDIASIINPTVARLSQQQFGSNYNLGPDNNIDQNNFNTTFFTYSKDSAVTISALSGDVNFKNQVTLPTTNAPYVQGPGGNTINTTIYPAQLHASALQGNISVDGSGITLLPSRQGALTLFAANNVTTDGKAIINLPDADPALLPGIENPLAKVPDAVFAVTNITTPKEGEPKPIDPFDQMHAAIPLYTNNLEPVRVVAQNGDVSNIRLVTPTHAWISAGRDINNVTFEFQHVNANDVSIVKAGRDIIFETPRNAVTNLVDGNSATQGIDITGYGSLDVIAGRNISLGASRGIQSIGAQRNPNLIKQGFGEESGADLNLWAGIKTAPDYAGYMAQYLGVFSAIESASTTEQLINSALNLNTSVRVNAEHFIKSVSSVTHRDYFSGVKLHSISDAEMGAYVTAARTDFQNLEKVKQQQIAFRIANARSDNYAGDLIELVTSARFGGDLLDVNGKKLDAASLLNKPIAEQYQLALAAFKTAPVYAQRQLILQTYFNEIKQGGIQDVSGVIIDKDKDGFARSTKAINTLFPTKDATATKPSENFNGDINLIFSTVQTQQGGNVNLIAPGGGIDVGAAAIGGGVSKDPSKLGLIALRNGSVNATVNGFTTTDETDAAKKQGYSIRVNASRVFALDGGDILLWSTDGDIDAGRGAKSALSVPPPVILEDGSVNFQAAVSGSGIRNSRFTADRSPGAVYLFAPTGVVNAGDAGIGSQGDVLIAAQQVIGADNIDVGGVSIGIPVSTGVSAGVASAGASTASATDSVAKDSLGGDLSEAVDQKGSAFVTIDILGFDF